MLHIETLIVRYRNQKFSHISCFNLASITEAEDQVTVEDISRSAFGYMVEHNHSFAVLADAQTVIGVNKENLRYLQAENLIDKRSNQKFANIKDLRLTAIAFNSEEDVLLAADDSGKMMAFNLHLNFTTKKSSLKLGPTSRRQTHYTQLPGHSAYAQAQLGNLTVLAGNGIVVIDTAGHTLVGNRIAETVMTRIMSVELCVMPGKVLMAISGYKPDYSGSKADVFDVTRLVNQHASHDLRRMLDALPQTLGQVPIRSPSFEEPGQAEDLEPEVDKDSVICRLQKEKQALSESLESLRRKLARQKRRFQEKLESQIDAFKRQIKDQKALIRHLQGKLQNKKHNLGLFQSNLIRQNVMMGLLGELATTGTKWGEASERGDSSVGDAGVRDFGVDSSMFTDSTISRVQSRSLRERIRFLQTENTRLRTKVEAFREVFDKLTPKSSRCEKW